MDETTISLVISIFALAFSGITFFVLKGQKPSSGSTENFSTRPLQLQAYERLVVLVERIGIPSLVSRNNHPDLSSKEMQFILLENIKQEVEYNSSQQIYVSPLAWEAVKNLKDQNMLVINQVASVLPAEAKGIDLGRALLDFVMKQKEGALHNIVLEGLNFEAKKLMQ
jgi:hypothetical protein